MRWGTSNRSLAGARGLEIWIGALGCFTLAAATGALFRFGMLTGLPAGLSLGNLRHAHSHLMYFGWVTPALMAMIAAHRFEARIPSSMIWILRATLILGLGTYVPFLLYGYQPVEWMGRRLPLATMIASLNLFAWYTYGGVYLHWTRRLDHPARPWWDLAVFFLILSSLGAWGRAALTILRMEDAFWSSATVHFFLNLFADGWIGPALIGVAGAGDPEGLRRIPRWAWWGLALGTPGAFLLTMSPAEVPTALRILAGVSGGVMALVLLIVMHRLFWRVPWEWRIPLISLGLRALAELGLGVPPIASWALGAGLRIFYIHLWLAGFTTLGLMAGARQTWGDRAVPGLPVVFPAIGFLLLSLIPLTGFWPPAWGGRWTLAVAFVGALFPVGVALGMLGKILRGVIAGSAKTLLASHREAAL